jgi:hypothetical protein
MDKKLLEGPKIGVRCQRESLNWERTWGSEATYTTKISTQLPAWDGTWLFRQ